MKILKVTPLDGYCITVFFDNNHSVIMDMKSKLHTVRFSELRNERLFKAVITDGRAILWVGGISIAISEIMEMIIGKRHYCKGI